MLKQKKLDEARRREQELVVAIRTTSQNSRHEQIANKQRNLDGSGLFPQQQQQQYGPQHGYHGGDSLQEYTQSNGHHVSYSGHAHGGNGHNVGYSTPRRPRSSGFSDDGHLSQHGAAIVGHPGPQQQQHYNNYSNSGAHPHPHLSHNYPSTPRHHTPRARSRTGVRIPGEPGATPSKHGDGSSASVTEAVYAGSRPPSGGVLSQTGSSGAFSAGPSVPVAHSAHGHGQGQGQGQGHVVVGGYSSSYLNDSQSALNASIAQTATSMGMGIRPSLSQHHYPGIHPGSPQVKPQQTPHRPVSGASASAGAGPVGRPVTGMSQGARPGSGGRR
jgi:hypothetical protein